MCEVTEKWDDAEREGETASRRTKGSWQGGLKWEGISMDCLFVYFSEVLFCTFNSHPAFGKNVTGGNTKLNTAEEVVGQQ